MPNVLQSITDPATESSFSAENAIQFNGRWGYKPSKLYDTTTNTTTTNTSYLPAPTTTETLLDKTTSSNAAANEYTVAIGVRVDFNTPKDTYTAKLYIRATANPILYSIAYDKNTTDEVANMPENESGVADGNTITLSGNIPEREGYGFIGWCATKPTTTDGIDSCSGITYEVGGEYPVSQTTSNIVTLYAQWEKAVVYMQDYTLARCQEEATNAAATLTDIRDGNTYTARFINGYCWMTQNLRLAGG
ncbi:MAG: hypothetical protein Q4B65_02530, partial [Candidatus Saccharibacteria bacterium]|nr:hypothetical protein [Candidatus Saccharibacteria bacterium]